MQPVSNVERSGVKHLLNVVLRSPNLIHIFKNLKFLSSKKTKRVSMTFALRRGLDGVTELAWGLRRFVCAFDTTAARPWGVVHSKEERNLIHLSYLLTQTNISPYSAPNYNFFFVLFALIGFCVSYGFYRQQLTDFREILHQSHDTGRRFKSCHQDIQYGGHCVLYSDINLSPWRS